MRPEDELKRRHLDWAGEQRTTMMCALCEWTHEGTAADGREAARLHRREAHPEVERQPRARLTPEQQRELAMIKSDWKRRKWKGED